MYLAKNLLNQGSRETFRFICEAAGVVVIANMLSQWEWLDRDKQYHKTKKSENKASFRALLKTNL